MLPFEQLRFGDPARDGIGETHGDARPAPRIGRIPQGSLWLDDEDPSGRRFVVALSEQPEAEGRRTVFGQIVRNFDGVTNLLLPGDRIDSIEIYEGDGTESLPALD